MNLLSRMCEMIRNYGCAEITTCKMRKNGFNYSFNYLLIIYISVLA